MPATSLQIRTKRIYAKPSQTDGTRVLVDRLWPRGVTKQDSRLEAWLKHLAPSNELKRWSREHPDSWDAFRSHYFKELKRPEATVALADLYKLGSSGKRLTLLFASKDEQRNHAVVLKELLLGIRKATYWHRTGWLAFRKRTPGKANAG